jgi:hypothetical protein
MQKEWMERHGFIACGTSVHQVFPAHITPNRGDTEKWENEGLFHDLAFYFDLPKTTRAQTVCEALLDRSPLFFQKNGASVTQVPTTDSPAFYPTMMIHRDTFLSLGGFNGHTVIHADKAFAYRLTRFHEIGNVPAILYTRLIHAQSLTQRPETGYSSSLRQVQHAALLEKDKKVSAAIENDDRETVLQLCVSDLYHADVRVADWQAQFAVPGL